MLKSIKVRLYLNKEQSQKVNSLLGSSRFVYNQCLNYRINRYENDKLNTSMSDMSHYFHQDLRDNYNWLKDHNTKVIKQSLINLDQAYKNFFKLKRGYPNFKSKHDEQKARFPKEAISKDTFKDDKLNLTKHIKDLKFVCSDRDRNYLIKNKELIKSLTITKTKTNKYFASILIDGDLLKTPKLPINESIGLDLGIKTLVTFSNGETIDNPKWIRSNEKYLKRLQRQLSKKVKGSNNRNKARLKFARAHERIRNQKQDFLHNLTSKIINENQVIIMEDLNVSGMMKNHKLAKSIQELSLYELKRQLEYKAKWYGRDLVFVDRFFPSSKTCSCCGWKNKDLKLSDREFKCQDCGSIIDRDLNASLNIEKEGLKNLLGQRLSEFTLGDLPLMESIDLSVDSNVRLNQELVYNICI
jgi:putative transposase